MRRASINAGVIVLAIFFVYLFASLYVNYQHIQNEVKKSQENHVDTSQIVEKKVDESPPEVVGKLSKEKVYKGDTVEIEATVFDDVSGVKEVYAEVEAIGKVELKLTDGDELAGTWRGKFTVNVDLAKNRNYTVKIYAVDNSGKVGSTELQFYDPVELSYINITTNKDAYDLPDEMNITVTVYDTSNSPVSGVPVNLKIYNPEGALVYSADALTDSQGKYSFTYAIPIRAEAGAYKIVAKATSQNIVESVRKIGVGPAAEVSNIRITPQRVIAPANITIAVDVSNIGLYNLSNLIVEAKVVSGNWWNGDWQYRLPIVIKKTAGNILTDYQIALTIDTASLISAGKMKSDCSDIRFVDENGNVLPYYIESGCNSRNTKIWIRLPQLYVGRNTTIYMYYGNPEAASMSNGKEVFDYFGSISQFRLPKNSLNGAHHRPRTDIYCNYWSDAGRDAFDGYGYTRLYSNAEFTGNYYHICIDNDVAPNVFTFNGRKYLRYVDFATDNGDYVLRIAIFPIGEDNRTYSLYQYGNLGSDGSTHGGTYVFSYEGIDYKFGMTWDWSSSPRRGDPNIFYFTIGADYTNQHGNFYWTRSRDNLRTGLTATKLPVFSYIGPTDNVLNDNNIKEFLRWQIENVVKQYSDKIFETAQGDTILIVRKKSDTPVRVHVDLNREERKNDVIRVLATLSKRIQELKVGQRISNLNLGTVHVDCWDIGVYSVEVVVKQGSG